MRIRRRTEKQRTQPGNGNGRRIRFTIGAKLLTGFLMVLVLLGAVAYTGLEALRHTAAQQEELNRINRSVTVANKVEAATNAKLGAVYAYLLTRHSSWQEEFNSRGGDVNIALAELNSVVNSSEARALLAKVQAAQQNFDAAAKPVFDRRIATEGELQNLVNQTLYKPREELLYSIHLFIANRERVATDLAAEVKESAERARLIMLAAGALAMVLGIGVAILQARGISRPVRQVAMTVQRLAAGDLTVPELQVRARDEVGDMARAFNGMVHSLRQLIQGVTGSTETVLAASGELSDASGQSVAGAQGAARSAEQVAAGATDQAQAADQMRQTVEELQQTIQQIAHGAQATAAEVQRASALLHQMVGGIDQVTGAARGVAESADLAAVTARKGSAVVEQAVAGMQQVREAVGESARRMRDLERFSVQIGEITQVISHIAEQTNLLALNAAIEAARAGEHGRGFAVVAEEVRKLAERSAVSTKEITDLIANIQSRTAEAVRSMEAGTTQVESGSQLAEDAGRALREILGTVEQAARDVQGIAAAAQQVRDHAEQVVTAFDAVAAVTEENTAATEEMAAGATQVSRTVERVAAISHETAAAAAQVSAVLTELTTSAGAVAVSAENLAAVAGSLREQAAQFKL